MGPDAIPPRVTPSACEKSSAIGVDQQDQQPADPRLPRVRVFPINYAPTSSLTSGSPTLTDTSRSEAVALLLATASTVGCQVAFTQFVPLPAARYGVALHKFFCLSKEGFGADWVDHELVENPSW